MNARRKVVDKEAIVEWVRFPCSMMTFLTCVKQKMGSTDDGIEISIEEEEDEQGPCIRLTTYREETDEEVTKRLNDEAAIKRHNELHAMVRQEEVERLMLAHLKEKYERNS